MMLCSVFASHCSSASSVRTPLTNTSLKPALMFFGAAGELRTSVTGIVMGGPRTPVVVIACADTWYVPSERPSIFHLKVHVVPSLGLGAGDWGTPSSDQRTAVEPLGALTEKVSSSGLPSSFAPAGVITGSVTGLGGVADSTLGGGTSFSSVAVNPTASPAALIIVTSCTQARVVEHSDGRPWADHVTLTVTRLKSIGVWSSGSPAFQFGCPGQNVLSCSLASPSLGSSR